MVDAVPVIDFSAYSLDREYPDPDKFQQLIEDVYTGLTTVGFMYLKEFRLPIQKVEDVFHYSRKFFSLPVEEKLRYTRTKDDYHGYLKLEDEGANPERKNKDMKEAFNYLPANPKQSFPDKEVPEFQDALRELFHGVIPLYNRLLEVMARGLNLEDPLYFVKRHHLIGSPGNPAQMRTLCYPALTKVEIKEDQVRCGEHTDVGGITLVFQDSQPGLEAMNVHGTWIPITPIDGTVVVIPGDIMQRWTSDKIIAPKHRVMLPADDTHRQQARQSIIFFGYPDSEILIECIDKSNKYPPIKSSDYMYMRFASYSTPKS